MICHDILTSFFVCDCVGDFRAVAEADVKLLSQTPNAVLLTAFTLHYVNRTLIFPFRIRGGKDTPLTPFLMAAIFCTAVSPSLALSAVSVAKSMNEPFTHTYEASYIIIFSLLQMVVFILLCAV